MATINPVNSPVEVKVVYLMIYKVLAPSQVVVWDFFHQKYHRQVVGHLRNFFCIILPQWPMGLPGGIGMTSAFLGAVWIAETGQPVQIPQCERRPIECISIKY